jgi:hypothetical protein
MDTPVSGTPRLLLRLEGVVVLVSALVVYQALDASWTMFALLLLVPDIGLVGYVGGPRVGAIAYNAVHTYVGAGLLAMVALAGTRPGLWPICLIWMAHIGMDRALGLGLKFGAAFKFTHLGTVGRA